jgi:DNA polymerase-3 subunit delta'
MREYFPLLLGNNAAKERLGSAIDRAVMPHAFLIVGESGSGKHTLVQEIAAAMNCENRGNRNFPLPCHKCNTCRRIAENKYTDLIFLRRTGDKATIGVEEVRLFREDMFLSPTESTYKIYIIEEADKLTVNAQNALLTVLEEPPQNVLIMLLASSADRILTTVKSRTQSVAMQRFDNDEMKKHLIARDNKAMLYSKTSPEILDGIIMSADGRVGRALSLLSDKEAKENKEQRALTEKIVEAICRNSPFSELYAAISEMPTARHDFIATLEEIIMAVRDIMLLKFDSELPLIFYTSREQALRITREVNSKKLFTIYEILCNTLDDVQKNVSITAAMADLGAKIKLL